MRPDDNFAHLLNAWLAAETAADDDAAEAELAMLMSRLSDPEPRADFADQVLAGAGIGPRVVGRHWRWALAAAVLLVPATLLAALATQLVAVLGRLVGPADPLVFLGRATLSLGEWVGAVAGLWGWLAELGRFTRLLVEAPQMQAALALCAGLAMLSYGALHALLSAQPRSAQHVDP